MVKRSTIRGNIITAGSSKNNGNDTNNQNGEMEQTSTGLMQLLTKISSQLDDLSTGKLTDASEKSQNTNINNEGKMSQELQSLFSEILAQHKLKT